MPSARRLSERIERFIQTERSALSGDTPSAPIRAASQSMTDALADAAGRGRIQAWLAVLPEIESMEIAALEQGRLEGAVIERRHCLKILAEEASLADAATRLRTGLSMRRFEGGRLRGGS